jgi:hypothetical protein
MVAEHVLYYGSFWTGLLLWWRTDQTAVVLCPLHPCSARTVGGVEAHEVL